MLILIFFAVSALAITRAFMDALIISRDLPISHTENAAITIITGVVASLFTSVAMFFFVLSVHWLVFDFTLNAFRGKPLNYTGSSVTDRFLEKYQLGITFKCILIIITAIIYDTTI